MKTNPLADIYVSERKRWKEEIQTLREVILASGLNEEIKWGKLCYTHGKNNVAIIYELKESVGIGFFKGALMKDQHSLLVSPGENSQAVKMIKFTDIDAIRYTAADLKEYLEEAVNIEDSGQKIVFTQKNELIYPEELLKKFKEVQGLETAFEKLTPGRRRAYILFFTSPKQSVTRESRIDKHVSRILEGKGMADY